MIDEKTIFKAKLKGEPIRVVFEDEDDIYLVRILENHGIWHQADNQLASRSGRELITYEADYPIVIVGDLFGGPYELFKGHIFTFSLDLSVVTS